MSEPRVVREEEWYDADNILNLQTTVARNGPRGDTVRVYVERFDAHLPECAREMRVDCRCDMRIVQCIKALRTLGPSRFDQASYTAHIEVNK